MSPSVSANQPPDIPISSGNEHISIGRIQTVFVMPGVVGQQYAIISSLPLDQSPDVAQFVIAKYIGSLQLGKTGPAVNDPARNGLSILAGIVVNRVEQFSKGGRRYQISRSFVKCYEPLPNGPTVVASLDDDIDFLTGYLPHVSGKEPPGRRVESHPPGVAQTDGIKFQAKIGVGIRSPLLPLCHQRIIDRDAVKCLATAIAGNGGMVGGFDIARKLVHVQPNDTGKKVLVHLLAVAPPVVGSAFVPQSHIQIPVGTKVNITAVVVVGLVQLIEIDDLGIRVRPYRIISRYQKTGYPVAPDALQIVRVKDENTLCLAKAGMKGQTQQTVFAVTGDRAKTRKIQHVFGLKGVLGQIGDHPYPTGPFCHIKLVGFTGRVRQSDWDLELAPGHFHLVDPGGQAGRKGQGIIDGTLAKETIGQN